MEIEKLTPVTAGGGRRAGGRAVGVRFRAALLAAVAALPTLAAVSAGEERAVEPVRALAVGRAGAGVVALVGFRVVPIEPPGVVEGWTVLVEGERIVALGPAAEVVVPDGARVIEGSGRFLLPGLVDCHVHLREAPPAALAEYLRAGVTTVRDMNGRPHLLAFRREVAEGRLTGPTLVVASPTLGNFSSPRDGYPTPETAAEATALVRRFAAEGYDWIKVWSFVPRPIFHALVDAARAEGLPIGGHPPLEIGIAEALRLDSLEHLLGYVDAAMTPAARELDAADLRATFHAVEVFADLLPPLAAATRAAGTWSCPTVLFFDHNAPAERMRPAWDRPEVRRLGHDTRIRILAALREAGAPIAVGTDSDAGDDLPADAIHEELANYVEAGFTPFEALAAAIRGGAGLLGLEAEIGSLAAGKRADLLVVRCDPTVDLACLRRPEMVMARGRLLEVAP